jgi:hypothetical protein
MSMTTVKARAEIARMEREHEALEKWAAKRVKPWDQLSEDDYNFRSWAGLAGSDVTHGRLQAGAYYEYARESRKLRCLLALMNPARRRKPWEKMTPPVSRRPLPKMPLAWKRKLREKVIQPCSFEDLDEHDAERELCGYLCALADLATYLADNVSFSELFETKRDELDRAFGGLDKLTRVRSAGRYFQRVAGVGLVWEAEAQNRLSQKSRSMPACSFALSRSQKRTRRN